jgi:hypothetical protein
MPVEFVDPPKKLPNGNPNWNSPEARRRGSSAPKVKRVTPELLMELARANGQWARVATGVSNGAASAYRSFAIAHPAIGLEVTTRRNADDEKKRDVYARVY